MAYITPNTDIVLCKNVPLDNSYDHTLTFANAYAQWSYFYNKATKVLNVNTYQRVMSNKLRIQCDINSAMECNYLYFNNSNYEQKFIYAFITGWEYINNVTTEITYEIDVFQTFWFDLDIKPSFIEREHTNDDTIGANRVPEKLEQGDYKILATSSIVPYAIENTVATNACALFFTTFNDDASCSNFTGGFASYVYTGLNVIKKETVNEIQAFVEKVITQKGSLDGIIAAYMCPYSPNTYDTIVWQRSIQKQYVSIDGYVPKNNKLFTAPYYILRIRNDVDMAEYKIEDFQGNTCDFRLTGVLIPEPTLTLIPRNYQMSGEGNRIDLRQTSSKYPQVALDADVYKVYLAQNAASLQASMIASTANHSVSVLGAGLSGNLIGVLSGGVSWATDVQQRLAQLEDISIRPPQLNGTQTTLSDYALGAKTFFADIMSIRAEFARIIDDYFNMYGYATHRVKTPNIFGRTYWNYVQTRGVVLDIANAPQPYVQKIIDCFNRGITFWHNPDYVGRYDLTNSIVT